MPVLFYLLLFLVAVIGSIFHKMLDNYVRTKNGRRPMFQSGKALLIIALLSGASVILLLFAIIALTGNPIFV